MLALAAIAVVGFAFAAFLAGRHSSYSFVSALNGQERMGLDDIFGTTTVFDGKLRYKFELPLSQVLPPMRHELEADGWKLVYNDDKYAAFRRSTASGDEFAELEALQTPLVDESPDHSKASYVVLPAPHKTWVTDAIDGVKGFFRRSTLAPPPLAAVEWGGKVDFEAHETGGNGKPGIELTWHNRTAHSDMGTIFSCFLKGYESDQWMPLSTQLGPWETKTITLTFPASAATSNSPRDAERIDCEYSASGAGYGESSYVRSNKFVLPPLFALRKAGSGWNVEIKNGLSRTIESMDLEGLLRGTTFRIPGTFHIPAYGTLVVPLPVHCKGLSSKDEVGMTGTFRILPNQRWVPFRSSYPP